MSKMTVSQGLRAIADLKGKLAKHREHAQQSVLFYDSEKPAFDFSEESDGAKKARHQMLRLKTAIAVSNATTEIDYLGTKMLVTYAIRFLEELKGEKAWVDGLSSVPQPETKEDHYQNRYVNGQLTQVNEPRMRICKMPQAEQFKRSQELQEEFNRLNDIVETSNHQTPLKLAD